MRPHNSRSLEGEKPRKPQFSDTVEGAKASATIYSLVLTCRACGVEPYDYLLHVLTELPQRAPDADVTDLLLFNYAWQQQAIAQGG